MPILTLTADGLDAEALQEITKSVCSDIQSEVNSKAKLATMQTQPGQMGEIEIIGQIIIPLGSAGAGGLLVLLAQALKRYIENRRLKMKLDCEEEKNKKKKRHASLDLTNLRGKEVKHIASVLEKFFKDC